MAFFKKSFLVLILFLGVSGAVAQGRFQILDKARGKVSMPFSLVNNMVVIEAEINGTRLSFLLDTGVNKTLLFNLKMSDSLQLNNMNKMQFRGLGEGDVINAYKSQGNRFRFGEIVNSDLSLFVITDNLFDLSAKMGIDVHGIIGGDLFRYFVVSINYSSRRLTFYDPLVYPKGLCNGCESFPLDFYNDKPYLDVQVVDYRGKEFKAKLLIDSGGGDALWLFPHSSPDIVIPPRNFDDFIGKGLSGDIYGKRGKVVALNIGSFEIEEASVSYPDSISIASAQAIRERNGTLGAEILKRFHVTLDYPGRRIILKKNPRNFRAPFLYNKSGMEISYGGEMLVKEKRAKIIPTGDQGTSITDIIYGYGLTYKPSYKVSHVRHGSPAHLAGILVGDILLEVNGRAAYTMKMQEVVHTLSQKEDKRIRLLIDRNGNHLRYEFTLKSLL